MILYIYNNTYNNTDTIKFKKMKILASLSVLLYKISL